jgi:hypothetical protein
VVFVTVHIHNATMSTSQAQALPLHMRDRAAGDRMHRDPAPLLWPAIAFIGGVLACGNVYASGTSGAHRL